MDNTHELPPKEALAYILAGHGKATLIGRTARYTFKFSTSADNNLVFVGLLTTPDNEHGYQYIGFIPKDDKHIVAGRKGNANHPAFKALAWYLHKCQTGDGSPAAQATFMHEGVCGRCGRTLTVPESIQRGIGPICAGLS